MCSTTIVSGIIMSAHPQINFLGKLLPYHNTTTNTKSLSRNLALTQPNKKLIVNASTPRKASLSLGVKKQKFSQHKPQTLLHVCITASLGTHDESYQSWKKSSCIAKLSKTGHQREHKDLNVTCDLLIST